MKKVTKRMVSSYFIKKVLPYSIHKVLLIDLLRWLIPDAKISNSLNPTVKSHLNTDWKQWKFVEDLLIFIRFAVKLKMYPCTAAHLDKRPGAFPLDVTFHLSTIYLLMIKVSHQEIKHINNNSRNQSFITEALSYWPCYYENFASGIGNFLFLTKESLLIKTLLLTRST